MIPISWVKSTDNHEKFMFENSKKKLKKSFFCDLMTHLVWFMLFESLNLLRHDYVMITSWLRHDYVMITSWLRHDYVMIWVSFESSRPDLEEKRVKSWKSRLFKKKFWDIAKLFPDIFRPDQNLTVKFIFWQFWIF